MVVLDGALVIGWRELGGWGAVQGVYGVLGAGHWQDLGQRRQFGVRASFGFLLFPSSFLLPPSSCSYHTTLVAVSVALLLPRPDDFGSEEAGYCTVQSSLSHDHKHTVEPNLSVTSDTSLGSATLAKLTHETSFH